MKKSLLVYSYSAKNAGDMAITLGALDYLTSKYDECKCISRYSLNQDNYKSSVEVINKRYKNVKNYPNPIYLDRSKGKLSIIKSYFIGFLHLIFQVNHLFVELVNDVETVYFNGGNLLRCNKPADFIRLIALLRPLKIALRANKKVVILPHSTAEINIFGKFLLKPILNKVHVLYAREEMSYKKFKNFFPNCNVKLSTDLAFAIKNKNNKLKRQKVIAFTTRSQTMGDIGELSYKMKNKIMLTLVSCVDFCLNAGYEVKLIVQTKKDLRFTRDLYLKFSNVEKVSFYESYDVNELIKIYSTCSLLIGMRLHSIILAMSTGTPAIGYFKKEWGLKNPGLLSSYGQKYVFLDDANNSLLEVLKSYDFEEIESVSSKITETKKILLKKLK